MSRWWRGHPRLLEWRSRGAAVRSFCRPRIAISFVTRREGLWLGRRSRVRRTAQIIVKAKGFATLPAGRVRSVTLEIEPPDGAAGYTVVYSGSAQRFDRTMNRLAMILVGIGVASALATTVVAVAVSRRVMRPLRQAAVVIGSIDERSLDQRIDNAALPAEVLPITQRLNEMLERLELVFAQRKQFLADAAHELRTPVAALLTTLEVSARRPRAAEAVAQTLQSCLADARMLKAPDRNVAGAGADGFTRGGGAGGH